MRILVACEYSGAVSRAFREQGHEAYSVDLLPADHDEDEPRDVCGSDCERGVTRRSVNKLGGRPDLEDAECRGELHAESGPERR